MAVPPLTYIYIIVEHLNLVLNNLSIFFTLDSKEKTSYDQSDSSSLSYSILPGETFLICLKSINQNMKISYQMQYTNVY